MEKTTRVCGEGFDRDARAKLEQQMTVEQEVLHIDETVEMEFNGEEGKEKWNQIVKINLKNSYGNGVVRYARRWAKYMQKFIDEGKTVAEIAEQTSYDADIEGVTGFMYGCAVKALTQCWKYGDELRKWHNKSFGYDGDGVVNPAVLTFNVGK